MSQEHGYSRQRPSSGSPVAIVLVIVLIAVAGAFLIEYVMNEQGSPMSQPPGLVERQAGANTSSEGTVLGMNSDPGAITPQ